MNHTPIDRDTVNDFVNALQLSIRNKIIKIELEKAGLVLWFPNPLLDDPNLTYVEKLIPGQWSVPKKPNHNCYFIHDHSLIQDAALINFLRLTRLNEENMKKIAELDPKYRPFTDKLGLKIASQITDLQSAAQLVFSIVEKQNMTLRQLSEATGLTQVSISNFKAGKDIMLSNFVKMIKALGLSIKIE